MAKAGKPTVPYKQMMANHKVTATINDYAHRRQKTVKFENKPDGTRTKTVSPWKKTPRQENSMVKKETLRVYEYPIKHSNGSTYDGSYTLRGDAKPLGYKGEHLVQTFTTNVKFTKY